MWALKFGMIMSQQNYFNNLKGTVKNNIIIIKCVAVMPFWCNVNKTVADSLTYSWLYICPKNLNGCKR